MMMNFRFGTAINCIDGRTREVVIDHMKQKYNIDEVDMVMSPGADGIFSSGDHSEAIALIRRAVSILIEKHGSHIIAVVGRYDRAGNPVTENITIYICGGQCTKYPHGIHMHKSSHFMSMTNETLRK
jgi:hypothetical protein